jgi:DNA-directed RNA polymerase subunit B
MFSNDVLKAVELAILKSTSLAEHVLESDHRFINRILPRLTEEIPVKDWHINGIRHVLTFGQVRYALPSHMETDGRVRPIYACEARLRGLNYLVGVTMEFFYKRYEQVMKSETYPCGWRLVHHQSCVSPIGSVFAQVKGSACRTHLSGMMVNENPSDLGGYYIQDGREKYFETHLRLRNNYARVSFSIDKQEANSKRISNRLVECEYRCQIEHLQKVGCSTHLYLTHPNKKQYYEAVARHENPVTEGNTGIFAGLFNADEEVMDRVSRANYLFQFATRANDSATAAYENVMVFLPNISKFNFNLVALLFMIGVPSREAMLSLICPWMAYADYMNLDIHQKNIAACVQRILSQPFKLPPLKAATFPGLEADQQALLAHIRTHFPATHHPSFSNQPDELNRLNNNRLDGMTRDEVIAHIILVIVQKKMVKAPSYDIKSGHVKPDWYYGFERFKKSIVEEFFPNVGVDYTWKTNLGKQCLMGSSVLKIVNVYLRYAPPDDLDHLQSKVLRMLGAIQAKIYRQYFSAGQKATADSITNMTTLKKPFTLKALVEKCFGQNEPLQGIVTSGSFTNASTGVVEFSGVSQEHTYLSTIGAIEQLRKVTTPLQARSDVDEAHQMHPSKMHYFCANHTPSNNDAGIKTYLCKSVHVRQGYDWIDIADLVLMACDNNFVVPIDSPLAEPYSHKTDEALKQHLYFVANSIPVMVNNNTIGFTAYPQATLDELRLERQRGYLPFDTAITWVNGPLYPGGALLHPYISHINIRTDDGGVTRPVFDLTNLWKLEAIVKKYRHSPKLRRDALVEAGVMVYLDPEEVGQAQIAASLEDMVKQDERLVCWSMPPDDPQRAVLMAALFGNLPAYDPEGVSGGREYCLNDHIRFSNSIPKQFRHSEYAKTPYTHCNISGDFLVGVTSGNLPFGCNTNAARKLFGAGMAGQSASVGACNQSFIQRNLSLSYVKPYKTLTPTLIDEVLGFGNGASHSGQMEKLTLFMSHKLTVEDATVHVRPDFGQGDMIMRTIVKTTINSTSAKGKDAAQLERPGSNCTGLKSKCYDAIGDDGLPMIGAIVQPGDALIGITFKAKPKGEGGQFTRRDRSLINRSKLAQVVVQVVKTTNGNGTPLVYVHCEVIRSIEYGNKGTTDGQKGVAGGVIPYYEMYYYIDDNGRGLIYEMIRGPHSCPSRTTMGEYRKALQAALVLNVTGILETVSNWRSLNIYQLQAVLQQHRCNYNGKQFVFNGATGTSSKKPLFGGFLSYAYLEHMATERYTSRAQGAIDIRTNQPTGGGSRNGGGAGRSGGMEVTNLIGQGGVEIIDQALFHGSDPTIIMVCFICGLMATPDKKNTGYCRVCQRWDCVFKVLIPYIAKIVMVECYAEGIALRLQLSNPTIQMLVAQQRLNSLPIDRAIKILGLVTPSPVEIPAVIPSPQPVERMTRLDLNELEASPDDVVVFDFSGISPDILSYDLDGLL